MSGYYIASCMFTAQFPEISMRMQNYIRSKSDIEIVRCCIPGYRVEHNTERIAGDDVRNAWKELPVSQVFQPEDRVISVCHNCTNIVEEWRGAKVLSLWEMIDQDPSFQFPDYGGMEVTVQDCWRTRERRSEQDAVRSLLTKMNIRYVEAEKHHGETDFCGSTLYREQPAIMEDYCRQFHTDMVVCYCHYCLEGLIQGKVNGRHIGELLFPDKI